VEYVRYKLQLTVCYARFGGNVTTTAADIAGGFWNVLEPSLAHKNLAVAGVIVVN
jgi:hypothetical protein